jgi:hypothetical protein
LGYQWWRVGRVMAFSQCCCLDWMLTKEREKAGTADQKFLIWA